MQQTISSEQQTTREEHPQPEADFYSGGDDFAGKGALEQRYQLHYAPPSGGFVGVAYERFLQMPVAAVLAVLWLVGMALLSGCVLMLYIVVT
jgi:hypothetical protein